jgi:hypothetical protein
MTNPEIAMARRQLDMAQQQLKAAAMPALGDEARSALVTTGLRSAVAAMAALGLEGQIGTVREFVGAIESALDA